jgi:hypothetical protein
MATIQELSDCHEEILERVGHLVAFFKEIDGDEPPILLNKMLQHVEKGRLSFIAAVCVIAELIELHREEEGSAEVP